MTDDLYAGNPCQAATAPDVDNRPPGPLGPGSDGPIIGIDW